MAVLPVVNWAEAFSYIGVASLAYDVPPGSDNTVDCDASGFVRGLFSAGGKYEAYAIEVPQSASYYSAAPLGTGDSDAQIYTLVYRDRIVFTIRGTSSVSDGVIDAKILHAWFTDVGYGRFVSSAAQPGAIAPEETKLVYVHSGWLKYFDSIKYTMMATVALAVLNEQTPKKIVYVGHSLGGAVATLAAAATIANFGTAVPVECHTFGSPQAGNAAFTAFFDRYMSYPRHVSRRYFNRGDVVPKALGNPLVYLGTLLGFSGSAAGYVHVETSVPLGPDAGGIFGSVDYHHLLPQPGGPPDCDYTATLTKARDAGQVLPPPRAAHAAGAPVRRG